jgi:ABC-type nitrate/sulfonate/bicarbonate transport system substrate-binding protein
MLTRRTLLALAAAAGSTAALRPRSLAAQSLRKLRVIAFPGGGNGWPIWAAQRQGFFAREGLDVELTPTPGSVYQMTHLIGGDFDIAHTAMDNIVAYSEGAGEVAVEGDTSLVAVMGGDNGFLHVLSRPQYPRYEDLRGKRLGVDALTTGFAFVLRKVLDLNGLHAGDYQLVAAGAGQRRYQALVNAELDATISSTPFDVQGEAAGLHVFGAASDVLGGYQGYVAATKRSWAAQNADLLEAYIRAYVRGLGWLYDPAQRDAAAALLVENGKMSDAVARKVAAIMVNRDGGYAPRAEISIAGVRTVIALRRQYGAASTSFGEPARYVDLRYYAKALG